MRVINICTSFKKDRPKRPIQPRKPKESFKKIEVVWSSHEDDITLSDVLHLIPTGVPAEKIFIRSERSEDFSVVVSYEHDVPNTKYAEQIKEYERKLAQYEIECARWEKEDAEWLIEKNAFDESLSTFQIELAKALDKRVNFMQEALIQGE